MKSEVMNSLNRQLRRAQEALEKALEETKTALTDYNPVRSESLAMVLSARIASVDEKRAKVISLMEQIELLESL